MLARANRKILGYLRDRTQHFVPPRLAARAVLRYWRVRGRLSALVLTTHGRLLAVVLTARGPLLAVVLTTREPLLALHSSAARGERRLSALLATAAGWLVPSPLPFLSHVLVLSLGFVLVVPVLGPRPSLAIPVAARSGAPHYITILYSGNSVDAAEADRPPGPHAGARVTPTPAPAPAPAQQIAARAAAPTAKPQPTFMPPPGAGGDGLAAIYAVFNGSPGLTWALRVANCESHYNPLAVNRYSGASGLFQFMPSTWNANFPGQNIWDPYAQARGALAFFDAGRTSAWTCK